MNKPIRTMAIFCMMLFLALMLNATYLMYVKADDLNDSALNRRVIQESFSRERGAILVGRDPLAESKPSDDEYKYQRVYSQPKKYAHVVGWFSYYSQAGIERTQNDVLSGDDSRLFVTRLVDMVSNSAPKGGSVELTLDPAAQQAAYDGLSAVGPDVQGAVVALQPRTGKILAMVSLPTFDPNKLASHDLNEVAAYDKKLNADPAEPKLNRAIQTTLPPGSTFKLVTAAAALESGNYTGDSDVPGGPTYKLPQSSKEIGNGGRACGTDRIPFVQALEQSCNTTFLALADELGNKAMTEQAEKFGFNSTSFEDLPAQAESVYPDDANEPNTALTGIGQYDVRATPLQMAMVAGGIANDGKVMKPYLVNKITDSKGDSVEDAKPEELSEAVSSETAGKLREMMVSVVNNGTANLAQIPGVDVAGKTGTAETSNGQPPHAWFISFAPANDPKVAVAIIVESGAANVGAEATGGHTAAPIGKAVMEAVLNK